MLSPDIAQATTACPASSLPCRANNQDRAACAFSVTTALILAPCKPEALMDFSLSLKRPKKVKPDKSLAEINLALVALRKIRLGCLLANGAV